MSFNPIASNPSTLGFDLGPLNACFPTCACARADSWPSTHAYAQEGREYSHQDDFAPQHQYHDKYPPDKYQCEQRGEGRLHHHHPYADARDQQLRSLVFDAHADVCVARRGLGASVSEERRLQGRRRVFLAEHARLLREKREVEAAAAAAEQRRRAQKRRVEREGERRVGRQSERRIWRNATCSVRSALC
eukprot:1863360-Pleurochrysis_carterae.AAC.1